MLFIALIVKNAVLTSIILKGSKCLIHVLNVGSIKASQSLVLTERKIIMELLKPLIIGAAPLVLASFIVVKLGYVSVEFGSDPFNRSPSEIRLQKELDKIETQRDNLKLLDKVFSFPSEKDIHIWQDAIASCEGKQTEPCQKLRTSLEGYASLVTGLAKQINEANILTK